VLIGGAWLVRQRVLAARAHQQRVLQTNATEQANAAAQSQVAAQQAKMETEAAGLEARAAAKPKDIKIHQALLLIYQQTGHPDKATDQLEAIARLRPKDQTANLALANARLALRQWPQAESAYLAFLKRWPKSPLGWQGLAAAQFHEDRYREAAHSARSAVELQPKNPNNRFIMAAALVEDATSFPKPELHLSELTRAKDELEKLTQQWPKVGDVYLRLGRTYLAMRNATSAIKNLERAHQLLPSDPDIVLYLSRSYTAVRDTASARKVLEAGVVQHPNSADLNDALGQVVQASGEPDADQKSLALFQKAVQINSHVERFQERLGTAYLRTNDLQNARQAFENAVRLDPDRTFPYQQLAAIYTRLGDPKRATLAAHIATRVEFNEQLFGSLQTAVEKYPRNPVPHLDLANRYRDLGMRGPARDEYLLVLSLDTNNKEALAGLAALDKPRPVPGAVAANPPAAAAPQAQH
jgi:tetratricopeptide (TPR) repeat protein